MKTVKIEGMHCEHCSGRVKKALEAMGLNVTVELKSGIATVDGASIPSDAELREAVEDLGFDVTEIR